MEFKKGKNKMELKKITDSRYSFILDSDESLYSAENKNTIKKIFGNDWLVYASSANVDNVKKHISTRRDHDISTLYHDLNSINDTISTHRDFIIRFDLIEYVKKMVPSNTYLTEFIIDYYSEDEIVEFCRKNLYPMGISELITNRLSAEQLYNLGIFNRIPDSYKLYRNLTDDEIFKILPCIKDLPGNRTENALTFIRGIYSFANISIEKLHVIYKSTWKSSKTDFKIGQTNGSGGKCKNACFLSWKEFSK